MERMKRSLCYATAVALVIGGSSIADQKPDQGHEQHGASSTKSTQSRHAMDDAAYVQMMQMHHEQGVKMAKLAIEKAERADVKQFAEKTASDQQQDIEKLERLENSLSPGTGGTSAHQHGASAQAGPEQAHGSGMMGHDDQMQMGQQMIDKLEGLSGAAFDREFLRSIAQHHKMAIQMSKSSAQFKSAEVKSLAAETVKKQSRELKEIEALQKQS